MEEEEQAGPAESAPPEAVQVAVGTEEAVEQQNVVDDSPVEPMQESQTVPQAVGEGIATEEVEVVLQLKTAAEDGNGEEEGRSCVADQETSPKDESPLTMYYCAICMENEVVGEQSFALTSCHHVYCRGCLAAFLVSKVVDGQVYPRCFVPKKNKTWLKHDSAASTTPTVPSSSSSSSSAMLSHSLIGDESSNNNTTNNDGTAVGDEDTPCDVPIVEDDILTILSIHPEAQEKYKRFKFCREHPHARECPNCHVFNLGDAIQPKITCTHCEDVYCFNHSNAHNFAQYPTCEEYEAVLKKETQESEDLIASDSKPCPRCKVMIMKTGGCNHMRCQCGTSFCWICGKEIDDDLFPAHFQWWNPAGCANMQMNEDTNPAMRVLWSARLFALMQLVVIGPLTVLSTFVSTLLCCCCMYSSLQRELRDGTNRAANHYQRVNRPQQTRSVLLRPDEGIQQQLQARNSNCCSRWYFSPFQIAFRAQLSTCMSSWGMFWMFLLFALPLGLVCGSVVCGVLLGVGCVVYPCYATSRLYQRSYPWPDFVTAAVSRWWGEFKRFIRDHCCCCYNATDGQCHCCCLTCRRMPRPAQTPTPYSPPRVYRMADRGDIQLGDNSDIDIELGVTKTTSEMDMEEALRGDAMDVNVESMQTRLDRMLRTLEEMEATLERSGQERDIEAQLDTNVDNEQSVTAGIPDQKEGEHFQLDRHPCSDLSASNQDVLLRELSEESTTFHDVQSAISNLLNEMLEQPPAN